MSDTGKGLRVLSVILMVIGIVGLVYSGVSLIHIYKGATKARDMALPLVYNFIPFLISFLLIRVGINILIKKNK